MSTKALSFRPFIPAETLKKVAEEMKYKDVSDFLNDAIREKMQSKAMDPKVRKFVKQVSSAAYEYMGWKFSAPSPREAAEIRRGVAEMKSGKVKTIELGQLIKNLRGRKRSHSQA